MKIGKDEDGNFKISRFSDSTVDYTCFGFLKYIFSFSIFDLIDEEKYQLRK